MGNERHLVSWGRAQTDSYCQIVNPLYLFLFYCRIFALPAIIFPALFLPPPISAFTLPQIPSRSGLNSLLFVFINPISGDWTHKFCAIAKHVTAFAAWARNVHWMIHLLKSNLATGRCVCASQLPLYWITGRKKIWSKILHLRRI